MNHAVGNVAPQEHCDLANGLLLGPSSAESNHAECR
jgi:hypothetical protein